MEKSLMGQGMMGKEMMDNTTFARFDSARQNSLADSSLASVSLSDIRRCSADNPQRHLQLPMPNKQVGSEKSDKVPFQTPPAKVPHGVEIEHIDEKTGEKTINHFHDGKRTVLKLDKHNRVLEFENEMEQKTTFAYDVAGKIREMTDGRGKFVTADGFNWYGGKGNNKGLWTGTVTVDSKTGHITEKNLLTGRATDWCIDGSVLITNHDGSTITKDPNGNVIETVDTKKQTTTLKYDAANKLIEMSDARGKFSTSDGTHWFRDSNKTRERPDRVGKVSIEPISGTISETNDQTRKITRRRLDGSTKEEFIEPTPERFQQLSKVIEARQRWRDACPAEPTKEEIEAGYKAALNGELKPELATLIVRGLHDGDSLGDMNKELAKRKSEYHMVHNKSQLVEIEPGVSVQKCWFMLVKQGENPDKIYVDARLKGRNSQYFNRLSEVTIKQRRR